LAGYWRHHEIDDGTYDFFDLVDINKVLDYMDENKRRASEAAENKR